MRIQTQHNKQVKRWVRKLVRSGLSKREASRATGVKYSSVMLWTQDMKTSRGKSSVSGTALKILKDLVSEGYAFPDGRAQAHSNYFVLRKHFPIRRVSMRGMTVFLMEGRERDAMEALLKRRNFRSISWEKLGQLRKAFGIKNIKRDNNKIL